MAKHNLLGINGEQMAVSYLLSKGYEILHTSWRYKHKEIDIIAMDKNCLVMVEVKTRSNDFWGMPEQAVTLQKQKFLIQAADFYIEDNNFDGECRFDIVSIVISHGFIDVRHITEAFYP